MSQLVTAVIVLALAAWAIEVTRTALARRRRADVRCTLCLAPLIVQPTDDTRTCGRCAVAIIEARAIYRAIEGRAP